MSACLTHLIPLQTTTLGRVLDIDLEPCSYGLAGPLPQPADYISGQRVKCLDIEQRENVRQVWSMEKEASLNITPRCVLRIRATSSTTPVHMACDL